MASLSLWCVPAALAERVLVLGEHGRVSVRHEFHGAATGSDPFGRVVEGSRRERARASARKRTIRGELARMLRAGAIDRAEHDERRAAVARAERLLDRLSGARRAQLAGGLGTLETIAAQGSMTVGRLEPLWRILDANIRWANEGPLLSSGQRVSFAGSELVYQYFPGSGLQLHPLANAGKLNDLWKKRRESATRRLQVLLDELLPLAAERSGGAAWEYYFPFYARAPWVSAMAQATMLQATARASIRLGIREETWPLLKQGLVMFGQAPPAGVRVRTASGAHYVLYSQRPGLRVLNGFAQSLVGLYDFGAYANDDTARALFAVGDAELQASLPRYDTGAWSLYSIVEGNAEANLNYHTISRDFLGSLCERTASPVHCDYHARFTSYLTQPPAISVVSRRLRGGTTSRLRLRLSKVSRVGVTVKRGSRTVFSASGQLPYGTRYFLWKVPRRAGIYSVTLSATDLAGNRGSATGRVKVLKPRASKRRRT